MAGEYSLKKKKKNTLKCNWAIYKQKQNRHKTYKQERTKEYKLKSEAGLMGDNSWTDMWSAQVPVVLGGKPVVSAASVLLGSDAGERRLWVLSSSSQGALHRLVTSAPAGVRRAYFPAVSLLSPGSFLQTVQHKHTLTVRVVRWEGEKLELHTGGFSMNLVFK